MLNKFYFILFFVASFSALNAGVHSAWSAPVAWDEITAVQEQENAWPEKSDRLFFAVNNHSSVCILVNLKTALSGDFCIDIFNLAGKLIKSFDASMFDKSGKVYWNRLDNNGSKITAGLYLIRMQTAHDKISETLIVME